LIFSKAVPSAAPWCRCSASGGRQAYYQRETAMTAATMTRYTAPDRSARKLTLRAQTAADLMTGDVVSIAQAAPLHQAVATLVDRGFSAAPVTDAAGRPIGVLSMTDVVIHDRNSVAFARPVPEYYLKSDLQAAVGEAAGGFQVEVADRTPVRDLMTPVVFSVRPDTPARQVIEEMLHLRVHRLFVIDNDGVLVGVISMTDVIRRLLD
jgi:CBS domain-containing protein